MLQKTSYRKLYKHCFRCNRTPDTLLKLALVAALATFYPVISLQMQWTSFKKIAQNKPAKAFVEGITAAVVGALVGSVIVIVKRSIIDIPTTLLAIVSIFALLYIKKI